MNARFSKDFEKRYQKLQKGERRKFDARLDLFMKNPFDPMLHNHELHGRYQGLRSIDVTGDLRALYKPVSDDLAFFVIIDTHSNLYE